MSTKPTDGIAELIGQIVEDLFNLLVREPDALKWSAAQRKSFRDWIANEAYACLNDPDHPGPSDLRVMSSSTAELVVDEVD